MKIVVKGVEMHLLQADHMLIIFEPDAIIFKCTLCAGTKDIHYLCTINSEQPLPYGWMKTCTCGNAPHSGGNTQPLPDPEPAQEEPMPPLKDLQTFTQLLNSTTFHPRLIGES